MYRRCPERVFSLFRQAQHQTVAGALRAAVIRLFENKAMRYKDSFYYWAAFIPHGFAGVRLDDALLDQIHSYLTEQLRQSQACNQGECTIEEMEETLSSHCYCEIEEEELTLSRQECQEYELLD